MTPLHENKKVMKRIKNAVKETPHTISSFFSSRESPEQNKVEKDITPKIKAKQKKAKKHKKPSKLRKVA